MILKYMNCKIIVAIFILVVSCFLFPVTADAQDGVNNLDEIHLHMFYGQGCPHCGSLKLFLESIKNKYPTLIVHEHEVYQNQQERELFEQISENFNVPIEGVPTVFIDDRVIVGFSNAIGVSIENQIKRCLDIDCGNPEFKQATQETTQLIGESSPSSDSEKIEIIKKLTIPVVFFAAIVDAINPCAFAVLIILMTAALSITNKGRALKFGLAFTASIYISYFLMGFGLFSVLQVSGISRAFYVFVTVLAIIVGLLNIKDYFWYGKGFLMEVPLSWRPAMKKILNSATTPCGAFVAGLAVSLFELPCTGGPYIVILGLLAKEVTIGVGILYLLFYNLIFVSPLIILSLIIYKGLSTTSKLEVIRQERIKVLHLVAGIIMILIALVMVLSLIKGWV
jgi:cytochrome c biogenesis protein CcdA/glutaredoxin